MADFADELWRIYFCNEKDCLDRWLLSLVTADEIHNDMYNGPGKHMPHRFSNHYSLSYNEEQNLKMRMRLRTEKDRLTGLLRGVSKEDLQEGVAAMQHRTISDFFPAIDRRLVMGAILMHLMVLTAKDYPELWNNGAELTAFVTHILCATMDKPDLPFPWHLGIFTDSYLKLSRTADDQSLYLDDLIAHRYSDDAERQLLLVFLAKYLKEEAGTNAEEIIDCIDRNPAMRLYFGGERLELLRHHFGGGERA